MKENSFIKFFEKLESFLIAVLTTVVEFYHDIPIIGKHLPKEIKKPIQLLVYNFIFAFLLTNCLLWIKKQITNLTLIYSTNSDDFIPNNYVVVTFKEDTAQLFLKLQCEGFLSNLKDSSIELNFPNQVTVQENKKYSKYYEVNDEGNKVIIKIESLFNTNKNNFINDSVIIGFYLIKNDEVVDGGIDLNFVNKKKIMKPVISFNEVRLKK